MVSVRENIYQVRWDVEKKLRKEYLHFQLSGRIRSAIGSIGIPAFTIAKWIIYNSKMDYLFVAASASQFPMVKREYGGVEPTI